jgi:hypothetical protein
MTIVVKAILSRIALVLSLMELKLDAALCRMSRA